MKGSEKKILPLPSHWLRVLLAFFSFLGTYSVHAAPASLFEFVTVSEVEQFRAVDDRVMGGVSNSSLRSVGDSRALFSGVVSLENNGGFASVRATFACQDVSRQSGLSLRVRGDGKRYKLRLMNSERFDDVLYQVEFSTKGDEWQEENFAFSSFRPVWRGKEVANRPAFDAHNLCGLGFLISDKQVGSFSLLIDWIRTY